MQGLTTQEAHQRHSHYGPNALPEPQVLSPLRIFIKQFLNPLIYILLLTLVISLGLGEWRDALFIGIVLVMNSLIGTLQEYSAERAAHALKKLEQQQATVMRDGQQQLLDARELVPGDWVLLEAGSRVPADLQLSESLDLQCDESLLTGESAPVKKMVDAAIFAGTLVTRGRGQGAVTNTGLHTAMGKIAEQIQQPSLSQPPLLIRMRRFTRNIAIAISLAILGLALIGWLRDIAWRELFMMSVGLAVSAIPEGLPIAISVALAISMRRMAKQHVIIRHLPAVESLGSCTLIATDKTGTLTLNELTVTHISLPDGTALTCDAEHDLVAGHIRLANSPQAEADLRVARLLRAAALPNEGQLIQQDSGWLGIGDTVDIALLACARKGGVEPETLRERYPLVARIPYEPDLKYAASFHQGEQGVHLFVKGAPEALIAMCDRMESAGELVTIQREILLEQKQQLAAQGLRVLAFAEGSISVEPENNYGHHHLVNLVFLGLVGMQDPLRAEVPQAIRACYNAGIQVAMITGDDPKTASVIAQQAGLQIQDQQVVTGADIRQAEQQGADAVDQLTAQARIYARIEPSQKLAIVLSLARNGHFVAVTGDGINDAPALKHAHVGVAMGKKGTDVAKESADIILTDDNFASIVAGISEGRVAYANIRKVIFMLISTGAAEVLLFLLALLVGTPMPLFAVQLLWLNLVTNGLQDVALVCEKAEGDELTYPPRKPQEPIFNRLMLRRILHTTIVMGGGGFIIFWWLLQQGYEVNHARNLSLLLFVLFENVQCLSSRSERHSIFQQSFWRNPFLIFIVIATQIAHISALYVPVLANTLHLTPVSFTEWLWLLLAASLVLVVMEIDKAWNKRRQAQ